MGFEYRSAGLATGVGREQPVGPTLLTLRSLSRVGTEGGCLSVGGYLEN